MVVVPWADFAPPPWAPQDAVLDLSSVTNVALYPTRRPPGHAHDRLDLGDAMTVPVESVTTYAARKKSSTFAAGISQGLSTSPVPVR